MKKPLDENALNQLFRSARTYPTWDTRKVPETMLRELYELAIMGPTSMNCLPARFVFITTPEGKAEPTGGFETKPGLEGPVLFTEPDSLGLSDVWTK